ncbi:aminopeptidase N [Nostocoides sp. F2B08]|uniref:aminopeptidase N n=1 Tax=Nostocoides sp. F2B08 TaxID=2653936 RepID=UPI0012639BAF|nr:aminopeptidase N [Tetrasphaera sp. F2B08]KAB7746391.1 aminopeptidase N [Tetrasphaera sp. F2B08]
MTTTTAPLLRTEARERARLITVDRMSVDLDLTVSDSSFASTTRIEFTCAEPGSTTWLDFRPVDDPFVSLNGQPIDLDGAAAEVARGRIPLSDLRESNVLEASGTMRFSRDGQGLHRAVDPADGEAYVYGHLFLDAAPTVFACFDQPDLKSPYRVRVTAPEGWTVLGNGAATETDAGCWELAETPPLSTYFVTVCAGPYASVLAEHDGIPLGVHARRSLGEALEAQAEDLFEVTRQSFDHYHDLFGIRYPFGEYHQVFVPEFNAGAMENPGCVTFRDSMVFRGAASEDQILSRANTIAHEMAHMWFGDLVTMTWWDDLWLNESFAEYMAYRTLVSATRFSDAWVEFSMSRKLWGYAAERTPSTHPVAGSPTPDAQSALQNFDGISYAKGASVLRQLIAHIGDDTFVRGVRAYLRDKAYGNGELADFLAAMEDSAGLSLSTWSQVWLRTAGVDVLAVDDGRLRRSAPEQYPARRPHTLDVGRIAEDGSVRAARVSLTEDVIGVPEEIAGGVITLPNSSDLTWATVELPEAQQEAVPEVMPRIEDPQVRAVLWSAVIEGVYRGSVAPDHLLHLVERAWPSETHAAILGRTMTNLTGRVIPCFVLDDGQDEAEAVVARAARQRLDTAPAGSSVALTAARALARCTTDRDLLERWAGGDGLPSGLEHDSDFRWLVVGALARRGWLGEDGIETARRADNTLTGKLAALASRASIPTEAAKAWAWSELTGNPEISNYEANAIAGSFWGSGELDLLEPYRGRYVSDVPAMARTMGDDALQRVAQLAFPTRLVDRETERVVVAALESDPLTPGVRRAMVDALSELREALVSRERFGAFAN